MNLSVQSEAPEEALDFRYDLASIIRRRNSLMDELSVEYSGRKLIGDVFHTFSGKVASHFPAYVKTHIIGQSLREHLGSKPTAKDLFFSFWRLAANLPALKQDKPVHPWTSQTRKEWSPLEILSVSRAKKQGKPGYHIVFQILGGSAAPQRISQFWSSKKVYFLALRRDDNGNGFMFSRAPSSRSRRAPRCIFISPKQLVSLRLSGLLDPDLSEDHPGFKEIRFSSGQSTHIREMIKKRERLEDKYSCPFNYGLNVLCHDCPVGKDRCPMACHAKTYVIDECKSCGKQTYFENAYTSCCLNCSENHNK